MADGAECYRRYIAGDDAGIVDIIRDYKDGLILFLCGYVGNMNIAEELAEDTFFRLMVKKPRFSGKSSFRSWLYAIGRNIAVDYLRKSSHIVDTPIEDMESYLRDESDLLQDYIREERRRITINALKKLSNDYRTVLWLTYFEEMTHDEVCVAMKKSARQVTNLLYRAKLALKNELIKEGFNYEEL